MTARVLKRTRTELQERRGVIAQLMEPDVDAVRARGDDGSLTAEERDLLMELEGIEFLLGADA